MSFGWRMGIVAQVDRVRRVVRGQLEYDYSSGEPPPHFEAYYHGDPPWPLSRVRLAQVGSGIWECFGPIGHRDVVLHEDFGAYVDISNAEQHFDHVWERHRGFADGTIAVAQSGSGRGYANLTTAATAAHYLNLRRVLYSAPSSAFGDASLWFSAGIRSTDTGNRIQQVALANAGGSDYVFAAAFPDDLFVGFRSDSSTNASRYEFLGARDASTFASIDTGITPSTASEEIFDIVLATGQWAVGWITQIADVFDPTAGSVIAGPFVIEDTNVPRDFAADGAIGPVLGIYPRLSGSQQMYLDWVHLESIAPVVHPTRDLILGQSGFQL